jgi:hypothetical protein
MEGIQIKAPDNALEVKYSNMVNIHSSQEEVVFDFLAVFPPAGSLTTRIAMSPRHAKRLIQVLTDTMKKYENSFGEVEPAESIKNPIGFDTGK